MTSVRNLVRLTLNASSRRLDIRQSLNTNIKTAMKSKDKMTLNTLRLDASKEYELASRTDLSDTELSEASVIEALLPPFKPVQEIDLVLQELLGDEQLALRSIDPVKKRKGRVIQEFYKRVDKSDVDSAILVQRVDALVTED
ncbi:GatB YqeY domain-containing protein [Flagelloscypha sp. PMI_526]|nr:GatB YqeY domain-containing protein [Flagelloscypha sp. PMI_526]